MVERCHPFSFKRSCQYEPGGCISRRFYCSNCSPIYEDSPVTVDYIETTITRPVPLEGYFKKTEKVRKYLETTPQYYCFVRTNRCQPSSTHLHCCQSKKAESPRPSKKKKPSGADSFKENGKCPSKQDLDCLYRNFCTSFKGRPCVRCIEIYSACCCGKNTSPQLEQTEVLSQEARSCKKLSKDSKGNDSGKFPSAVKSERQDDNGKVRKYARQNRNERDLDSLSSKDSDAGKVSARNSEKGIQDKGNYEYKSSESSRSDMKLVPSGGERAHEDQELETFESTGQMLLLKSSSSKGDKENLMDHQIGETEDVNQQQLVSVSVDSPTVQTPEEMVELEFDKDLIHGELEETHSDGGMELMRYSSDCVPQLQDKYQALEEDELLLPKEVELQASSSKEQAQDQELHREIISQSRSLAELKEAISRHDDKIQIFQQQLRDFHCRDTRLDETEGQKMLWLLNEEHMKELLECKNLLKEHGKKFDEFQQQLESTCRRQEASTIQFLHRIEGLEEFLQEFSDSEKTFIIRNFSNRRSRWRSPGMYSDQGGFKFSIEVIPSAQNLKFFLTPLKGLYDDELKWPISVMFVLKILNQKGRDDWKGVFTGDINMHRSYEVTSLPYTDVELYLKKDAMCIVISKIKQN